MSSSSAPSSSSSTKQSTIAPTIQPGSPLYQHVTSVSDFEKSRLVAEPTLPAVLQSTFHLKRGNPTTAAADAAAIEKLFPLTYGQPTIEFVAGEEKTTNDKSAENKHTPIKQAVKVGIVLSGGPAAGGLSVISGVFDYLTTRISSSSQLFGFLDGPSGLIDNKFIEITADVLAPYRHQGGFHIIGSGRTKIETPAHFAAVKKTVLKLNLNGLIIVGGDDSNTNAAVLAEYFLSEHVTCSVVGIPKTIDGDLRNEYINMSFGFDTATKIYSERIAALAIDAVSARKTYHWCRLMGRTASHITLECALQTHPNVALIGEEIQAKKVTLAMLTKQIADVIVERSKRGKHYGIIILPEGLVDFLVDISQLLEELNDLIGQHGGVFANIHAHLSHESQALFHSLPPHIAQQLMMDRDPHGNVQVSKIESERLISHLVENELKARKKAGQYKGTPSFQTHFLGYEGRCATPTVFDSNYCYALGFTAGALIQHRYTGVMAVVSNLILPPEQWSCCAVPLTHMMNMERRLGHQKPVIKKALVNLNDKPFQLFRQCRHHWMHNDAYRNPGPIQFTGPHAHALNLTMLIEQTPDTPTKTTEKVNQSKQALTANQTSNSTQSLPSKL